MTKSQDLNKMMENLINDPQYPQYPQFIQNIKNDI